MPASAPFKCLITAVAALCLLAGPPARAAEPMAAAAAVDRCLDLRRSEPGAAVRLADSILQDRELPVELEIKALACLGIAAGLTGEGNRAAHAADRVLERVDAHPELPPAFTLRAVSNAGAILHSVGQVYRAEAAYMRANDIARRVGTDDSLTTQAVHLTNIGLIHADYLDSPQVADGYYRQALALFGRAGHDDAQLLYNHAVNLLTLGRTGEARTILAQAEALAASTGNRMIALRVKSERAGMLVAQGRLAEAGALLVEVMREQPGLDDPAGEASTLAKLSALQRARGDRDAALVTAGRAWALVEHGYHHQKKVETLRALLAAHTALGHVAQAADVSQRLHSLRMDTLKQQRLDLLADLQARSRHAAAEHALEKLRHDHQVESLRAEKAAVVRNAAIGVLLLVVVAVALIAAIQRRRNRNLRRISAMDPLTGLKNRRTATRELNALVRRAPHDDEARHVVFLIDIDHFKKINDTFGHHAGDAVLVAMSRQLQDACRQGDIVARWGGEEFLVACPNLRPRQAEEVAERLRASMTHCFERDGMAWRATSSIGLAAVPTFELANGARGTQAWDYALRLADRALYAAKQSRDTWLGYWSPRFVDGAAADAVVERPEVAAGVVTVLGGRTGEPRAPTPPHLRVVTA